MSLPGPRLTAQAGASLVLYGGPTLHRALAIAPACPLDGIEILPPIQRGELAQLVARRRRPATVAIVDGLFHESLAVGHAEIRDALAAGWQVWGLSSMGAIRAREMMHLGMRGFGEVFALYCQPCDFRDDEVTMLHAPDPPYRELSEPLVHLRLGLEALALPPAVRAAVTSELENLWYGERTFAWLAERLRDELPDDQWRAWLSGFDRFRIKAHDLARFVVERPWLTVQSD